MGAKAVSTSSLRASSNWAGLKAPSMSIPLPCLSVSPTHMLPAQAMGSPQWLSGPASPCISAGGSLPLMSVLVTMETVLTTGGVAKFCGLTCCWLKIMEARVLVLHFTFGSITRSGSSTGMLGWLGCWGSRGAGRGRAGWVVELLGGNWYPVVSGCLWSSGPLRWQCSLSHWHESYCSSWL